MKHIYNISEYTFKYPKIIITYVEGDELNNYNIVKVKENFSKHFYLLFGTEIVRVDYINYNYGDQIQVFYTREDGTKDTYIGDNQREFDEDFIETNDSFIEIKTPIISKNKINTVNNRYNVVYYIGNTKIETIANNIDYRLANILKNTNSKNPNYKKGKIVTEIIK